MDAVGNTTSNSNPLIFSLFLFSSVWCVLFLFTLFSISLANQHLSLCCSSSILLSLFLCLVFSTALYFYPPFPADEDRIQIPSFLLLSCMDFARLYFPVSRFLFLLFLLWHISCLRLWCYLTFKKASNRIEANERRNSRKKNVQQNVPLDAFYWRKLERLFFF